MYETLEYVNLKKINTYESLHHTTDNFSNQKIVCSLS